MLVSTGARNTILQVVEIEIPYPESVQASVFCVLSFRSRQECALKTSLSVSGRQLCFLKIVFDAMI